MVDTPKGDIGLKLGGGVTPKIAKNQKRPLRSRANTRKFRQNAKCEVGAKKTEHLVYRYSVIGKYILFYGRKIHKVQPDIGFKRYTVALAVIDDCLMYGI